MRDLVSLLELSKKAHRLLQKLDLCENYCAPIKVKLDKVKLEPRGQGLEKAYGVKIPILKKL